MNNIFEFCTLRVLANEKEKEKQAKEQRTKRFNLRVEPSVLDDIQKIAALHRESVNNLICNLLYECLNKNKKLLNKYDLFFKD